MSECSALIYSDYCLASSSFCIFCLTYVRTGPQERTPHTMNSHFAACSGRRMETLPAGLGRSLPGFAWSSPLDQPRPSQRGLVLLQRTLGALHELDFCLASTPGMRTPAPAFFFCLGIFLGVLLDADSAADPSGFADETDTPDASPPVGIGPRLLDVGIGPMPGTAPRPPMGRLGRGPIIIGGIGCGCK